MEEHASDLAELPVPVIWQNCLSVDSVPLIWQNNLHVEEQASDLAELFCASDLAELSFRRAQLMFVEVPESSARK